MGQVPPQLMASGEATGRPLCSVGWLLIATGEGLGVRGVRDSRGDQAPGFRPWGSPCPIALSLRRQRPVLLSRGHGYSGEWPTPWKGRGGEVTAQEMALRAWRKGHASLTAACQWRGSTQTAVA